MLVDDLKAFARDPKGYPDSAAAHLCKNAAELIEQLREENKNLRAAVSRSSYHED